MSNTYLHATNVESNLYLSALSGLRGVAAGWVFLYHFWQFAGSPGVHTGWPFAALVRVIDCGYFAVDLFFVLSGFLLGLPYAQAILGRRPWPSLHEFWIRRCRRVLPAYWAQLVILFCIMVVLGATPPHALLCLMTHALLIFNFFPLEVPSSAINGVYWSLPVEWDFYMVLPLFALLLMRARLVLALSLVFSLALGWRYLSYTTVWQGQAPALIWWWAGAIQQLPARLDQFFLGLSAAYLFLAYPGLRRYVHLLFGIGIILLLALVMIEGGRGAVIAHVDVPLAFIHFSVLALGFALIILSSAFADSWPQRLFEGKVLAFLGSISYSLYLWHYPVLQAMAHFGVFAQPALLSVTLSVLVVLPLCLAVATTSYYWLERPFLRPRQQHKCKSMNPLPVNS